MIETDGKLAVEGGRPIRATRLPYGRPWLDDQDIAAVVDVLRGDWLTTGPRVEEFEHAFARAAGAREAVAVSSGTSALHAMAHAAGLGPDAELIVPAMTFAASANCAVFMGARPVFADVQPDTLLLDPASVEARISPRTRAVLAVDYAGQPCDYAALGELTDRHGLLLLADACHSLGATYQAQPVGALALMSAFSLHPVKHITTGEGGCVTTDAAGLADRMRRFRNHGLTTSARSRAEAGSWVYEMIELGYNYRLTDFQCALGLSQLRKLEGWIDRRRELAARYDRALAAIPGVRPLATRADRRHAHHLYVVQLELDALAASRAEIFRALSAEGIGVNVHYIPVHLHPFYRERFGTRPGDCPVAEAAYERMLTLPLFPQMSDADVEDVAGALHKVLSHFRRRAGR